MNVAILEKFHKSFIWNISGSTAFELLKLAHNVLLFHCLPKELYGSMGSVFVLIYLASRFIESGASYTIPPFFYMMQTKQQFKRIFLSYYLLPLIPLGICISIGILIFYQKQFLHNIYLVILPILMILEAIRSVLRQFLHTAFKSKQTIVSELFIFCGYLGIVWGGFYFAGYKLTLNFLFIPYVIYSILALILFSYLISKFYKKLPDIPILTNKSDGFHRNYLSIRLFNFLLKTSRDLFTSNFITPLFVIRFGLVEAGIFYFASTLATAAQAIIKASIGYSGSALLANLKHHSLGEKREAFMTLSKKLTQIILPLIIILISNYNGIASAGRASGLTKTTLLFALLYFFIVFSEFFFLLYEQFYLVEEASKSLFLFKALEFILFFTVIFAIQTSNPLILLIHIIGIRSLSFVIVAINAFFRWRIRPKFRVTMSYLVSSIGIAILIKLLTKNY